MMDSAGVAGVWPQLVRTKKAVLKSDEVGIGRLLEKRISPRLFWLFLVYLSEK
ncbi:hypothetical protein [Streptococcus cristatus]|uniref:hypothetical protein n=1 Tax=Streptococcus cristatus TaxID=45634 RepID=UPI0020006B8D|nr:hypothetical protein [Streptococcus cristatus]